MSTNNDAAANADEVVEVARPGRQSRVLRGIAARWVIYIMDYAEFLGDSRNQGTIEFSFSGRNQDVRAVTRINPQP